MAEVYQSRAPQVSVVMAVYNGSAYIANAIESILQQEDINLEFIVINDGSTDGTLAILEEYASDNTCIRLYSQKNRGLTKSLITGCSKARAPFIARQDADDISLPGRLKQQYDLISGTPKLGMVSCWTRYIGPSREILGDSKRPSDSNQATRELLFERKGPPAHGSVMFRKSVYDTVGGYRPVFYYGQDSDLWLRMGGIAEIANVPEFLYEYRYWPGSISMARREVQKKYGKLGWRCHLARMNNEPEGPWIQKLEKMTREQTCGTPNSNVPGKVASNPNYFLGSMLMERGDPKARSYLIESVKKNPRYIKGWVKLLASSIKRHQ